MEVEELIAAFQELNNKTLFLKSLQCLFRDLAYLKGLRDTKI